MTVPILVLPECITQHLCTCMSLRTCMNENVTCMSLRKKVCDIRCMNDQLESQTSKHELEPVYSLECIVTVMHARSLHTCTLVLLEPWHDDIRSRVPDVSYMHACNINARCMQIHALF